MSTPNNDVINVLHVWARKTVARNHSKKFSNYSQTSFSGIVQFSRIPMLHKKEWMLGGK